jgi:hypothetical protein
MGLGLPIRKYRSYDYHFTLLNLALQLGQRGGGASNFKENFVQFTVGGCSNLYYALIPIKAGGMGIILQTVLASALLSASLWGLIQGVYPDKNPLPPLGISPGPTNTNFIPTIIPGNTTCPSGQTYSIGDNYGSAGCRCNNSGRPPINGRCYSSVNPDQSAAPSSSDQIVEARAYKNGVEVTQSIGL